MSALHFASIDLYAKRIIQMGEDPEKVFVVGALGLDNRDGSKK
jgi:UDP-N-acetylglucosamine 2-epimerase